MTACFVRPTKN